MSLKGKIQPDHIPGNKYELRIVGFPTITIISISGMETEVDSTELPDRTMATGGQVGTSEVEVVIPQHHTEENLAMEVWLREGKDPVTPTYKKQAVLTKTSNSGETSAEWSFSGTWIKKRSISDAAFEQQGDMATVSYTLSVDEISPLVLP